MKSQSRQDSPRAGLAIVGGMILIIVVIFLLLYIADQPGAEDLQRAQDFLNTQAQINSLTQQASP